MDFLQANDKLSIQTATSNMLIVKKNECYTNIAHIALGGQLPVTDSESLVVAFGGVQIFEEDASLYAKHAFFIVNDQVVDPTLAIDNLQQNKNYFVIRSYAYDDYIELMKENMHSTPKSIEMLFRRATAELMPKGVYLTGD